MAMSSDSAVIAAIDRAVQVKNQYNIRVINLSLGRPIVESCTRDPLCQAVEHAHASAIEPIYLPAAANSAIEHLALAMRATLRSDVRRVTGYLASDHVARADAYIADHLQDQDLSVEQVARSIGISCGVMSKWT